MQSLYRLSCHHHCPHLSLWLLSTLIIHFERRLREDGSDGIIIGGQTSLGRVYEYLQTLLLHLKNCGLLLCICSKNYQTDVLEVFKTNKSLLLAADDFVLIKCSDRPKSEMIREISCELNISYDQFLFLDDSKHERDEVSTNLPGIVVPDLPNDIFQWPLYLLNNQKFQLILNTYNAPDNRSEKYKTRIKRQESLNTVTMKSNSYEDWLISLNQILTITVSTNPSSRSLELFQRTNQFNLSGSKHSKNELGTLLLNYQLLEYSASDIHGDDGVIGVILSKFDNDTIYIYTMYASKLSRF